MLATKGSLPLTPLACVMVDYPATAKYERGKSVLYFYQPFRRQARKDELHWVQGAQVLTLLVPKANHVEIEAGKKQKHAVHFGGREHRITPRTVLQHGADSINGYTARRYQLVEPKSATALAMMAAAAIETVQAEQKASIDVAKEAPVSFAHLSRPY